MAYCERCGKNDVITSNLYMIDFIPSIGSGLPIKDSHLVCQSCYNKILTYTLTRPIKKEEN